MPYQKKDGTRLPSVTECLKMVEQEALTAWKLRTALEAYDEGYKKGKGKQALEVAEEAAVTSVTEIGTWIHQVAAARLLNTDEPPILKGAVRECNNLLDNLDRVFDALPGMKPLSIETPVFGSFKWDRRVLEYAGTPDAIVSYKGGIILIDFKSSKELYPTMAAQVAAYIYAWNKANPEGMAAKKGWLIQVDKYSKNSWGIKNLTPKEISLGWDTFRAACILWYIQSQRWGVPLAW